MSPYAKFTLVAGGEHDGAKLVGESHQQRTACTRLKVLLRHVFVCTGKNPGQRLAIGLEDVLNWKQFETNL